MSATHHATRRATLAGLGTAGTLVGAVAAVAALTGGVVAFSGWPGSPQPANRPAVALGGAHSAPVRAASAASAAVATASPAPAPGAVRRAATTGVAARPAPPSATADTGAVVSGGRGSAAGGSGQAKPTQTPSTATSKVTAKQPLQQVADATDSNTAALAQSIKQGGQDLGNAAAPASATLGDAVAKVTANVSDAVAAAGKAIGAILRGPQQTPTSPPGS
jgi:hypothetical protein